MTKKADISSIQLRSITDHDLPFLYHVYHSTRINEFLGLNWSQIEIESFLQNQFNLQHTQYQKIYKNANFNIIEYNNIPVGRLYYEITNKEIRIIDIALLKKYRRLGIGGYLMKYLIKKADSQKISISLHVEYNNPIMDFYKKLGFITIKEKERYNHMEKSL